MAAPERLTAAQIAEAVAARPGLHTGAQGTLVLRLEAPSFSDAVRLVEAVSVTAEELDHHPDVDIRWRSVTFTLSTHSVGGVTAKDVELAGQILEHGTAIGAEVREPPARVEIALDVVAVEPVFDFWRVGLGYVEHVTSEGERELRHPDGAGPPFWFQLMDPPRTERGRFHLDVHVPAADAPRRVEETVAAGGRLVTAEFAPSWWVLADAEGNELCVCTAG